MAVVRFEAHATVTIFPDRLRRIPVAAPQRFANDVLTDADTRIGTRYSGQGQYRRRLRGSGRVVKANDPTNANAWAVVYKHPIARLHHEGSKPHSIGGLNQRLANPRTPATSRGGPFFARGPVHHPGTRPNRYLVDAARAKGLKVQSPSLRGKETITAVIRARA